MITTGLVFSEVTVIILYKTAINEERAWLIETEQSQVHLIRELVQGCLTLY
jgi:hypothetical protein